MRRTAAILAAFFIALAAAPAFAYGEFNVRLFIKDVHARPTVQEDYFLYVNYDWMKTHKIPATKSAYGVTAQAEDVVRERLAAITGRCLKTGAKDGEKSDEARIANLRRCIADTKGREKTGLGELAEPLREIDNVKTIGEYGTLMGRLMRSYGVGSLFGSFGVDVDIFTADCYRASIGRPGMGLGREFYQQQGIEDYLKAYTDYIAGLLELYGRPREAAERSAGAILAYQQDLARHALSKAEMGDPSVAIRELKLDELKKIYGNFDIEAALNAAGIGPANGADRWITSDGKLLEYAAGLCTPDRLQLFKDYAIFSLLDDFASVLPAKYARLQTKYVNFLNGVRKNKPKRKADDELCEELLPFCYGRLYGKLYFSPADKKEVTSYVMLVMNEYRKRLASADWLCEATRKQALKKLDTMVVRVGYPDQNGWPPYLDALAVKGPQEDGTLIGNAVSLGRTQLDYSFGLLGKPVDRNLWTAEPQMVNAFYNPSDNSINFPAGYLLPPFYDPKASRETNLGDIGNIIGHEMTHCFDSCGAQYDEHGALRNWWTEEDYREFKKRQAAIVKYYNRYKLADGIYQDGAQTLTENIADLGGLSCIASIVGDDPAKLRAMYESYAVSWRVMINEAEFRLYLTDEHAIDHVRADATASAEDSFYKAYDVKPGDPMYVAPEERVRIW